MQTDLTKTPNLKPWVSFCISTFKRPQLLKTQIELLLKQTFTHFEIIISDNDPEASASPIANSFGDLRIKYFHNVENLGIIKSFNKSIDRAATEYIVMVTDDDPINETFLTEMFELCTKFPGFSIYCGFIRTGTAEEQIEVINKEDFLSEILNTDKTSKILWSSSVMKREDAIQIGKIPDYGSPHLADHAFIVMVGSVRGGVVINKMYSSLTSHDTNFSKFNFNSYYLGCYGFYESLLRFCKKNSNFQKDLKAIDKHLVTWFISSFSNLRRFYTLKKDPQSLADVERSAAKILELQHMKKFKKKYLLKRMIFKWKRILFFK